MRTEQDHVFIAQSCLHFGQIELQREFILAGLVELVITPRRGVEDGLLVGRDVQLLADRSRELVAVGPVQDIIAGIAVLEHLAVVHEAASETLGRERVRRNQIIPFARESVDLLLVAGRRGEIVLHIKCKALQRRAVPGLQEHLLVALLHPAGLLRIEHEELAAGHIVCVAQTAPADRLVLERDAALAGLLHAPDQPVLGSEILRDILVNALRIVAVALAEEALKQYPFGLYGLFKENMLIYSLAPRRLRNNALPGLPDGKTARHELVRLIHVAGEQRLDMAALVNADLFARRNRDLCHDAPHGLEAVCPPGI